MPQQTQTDRYSPEAIDWLRVILSERYGLPLRLSDDNRGYVELSLSGSEECIRITSDPTAFHHRDSQLPCGRWNAEKEGWKSAPGKALVSPGQSSPPTPLVARDQHGYTLRFDILGLIYWMLTRQEEIGRTDLDEHGRFPATSSHAWKHGYLERPIVDEWLDVLGQVIRRTWPDASLREHSFDVKVSHDVDRPSVYGFKPWPIVLRGMGGDILKRRDLGGLLRPWIRLKTRRRFHPLDKFNTFDWLMDVSESHDLTSAFYFICDRRGTPHDSDYDLRYPAIRALIRRIHSRGHEIGLHPSYNTFLDPAQIEREANRLRQVCAEEGVEQRRWGGRMHYLQWAQPTTLRAWSDAGMDYDSSMTYADQAGFRCGTCFEYPAFDPVAQQPLHLRIRPLVVMEGSIFGAKYMALGETDRAYEKILQLKAACRTVSGTFTLLWHNSSLVTKKSRDIYKGVLND